MNPEYQKKRPKSVITSEGREFPQGTLLFHQPLGPYWFSELSPQTETWPSSDLSTLVREFRQIILDLQSITETSQVQAGVAIEHQELPSKTFEQFGILISDEYYLTNQIPIEVYHDEDGSLLVSSSELNLYAEGDTAYEARREFSEVLIEQLKDLQDLLKTHGSLGKDLRLQLNILSRLLRRI